MPPQVCLAGAGRQWSAQNSSSRREKQTAGYGAQNRRLIRSSTPSARHPKPRFGVGIKRQILSISKGEADSTSLRGARGATLGLSTAEADAMKVSGIRASIVALPTGEALA
jgi:hypothetical protein